MSKDEAELLAVDAVRSQGNLIGNKEIWSEHFDENSRLSDSSPGWLVAVPIDVPKGFDAELIIVEVFEPEGKINFPYSV